MGVEYGLYDEVTSAKERNPGNAASLPSFGTRRVVGYCLRGLDPVLPVKELKGRISSLTGGLWKNLKQRIRWQRVYYKETQQGPWRERLSEEKGNSGSCSWVSL